MDNRKASDCLFQTGIFTTAWFQFLALRGMQQKTVLAATLCRKLSLAHL